ncbi:DUF2332 domain-containing protein [Micromonospora chersina]|uniref:DUF2332 domain-containing protein n=1 Tax=Micromonospora chersina TaxID=47854 RepID=UPI0033B2B8FF
MDAQERWRVDCINIDTAAAGHDADGMDSTETIAARYRAFADQQAADSSPTFREWALYVAASPKLLDRLSSLPSGKEQPNLVFAAARMHGAIPGDSESLHDILDAKWPQVRGTILTRSTQTNEAARCAALLLGMQQITGPIALLEVGAAAGLCLIPDRYSYTFNEIHRLDPVDATSDLTIPITLRGSLAPPSRMPDIVWRAGLDLNPLDPGDVDAVAWLQALVWPEHEPRRERLAVAARLAARENLDIQRGNVLDGLDHLAQKAPVHATLVITHSATLAYLDEHERREAVQAIAATGARRISFEGRGVDPAVPDIQAPATVETLFVAALDGMPYALADGHGNTLTQPPAR